MLCTHFETFDLIGSQPSLVIDFLKVNIPVVTHADDALENESVETESVETAELPARLTKTIMSQAKLTGHCPDQTGSAQGIMPQIFSR